MNLFALHHLPIFFSISPSPKNNFSFNSSSFLIFFFYTEWVFSSWIYINNLISPTDNWVRVRNSGNQCWLSGRRWDNMSIYLCENLMHYWLSVLKEHVKWASSSASSERSSWLFQFSFTSSQVNKATTMITIPFWVYLFTFFFSYFKELIYFQCYHLIQSYESHWNIIL